MTKWWKCDKHGRYAGDHCPECAREAVPDEGPLDDQWWQEHLPEIRLAVMQLLHEENAALKARVESAEAEVERLRARLL